MADIISIKAHPRSHERSALPPEGTVASIIMFPGVRYERTEAAPDSEGGAPRSSKRKSASGGRRKSQA